MRCAVLSCLLVVVGWLAACATANASPSLKRVSYHGYAIRVPAGWPVYRLAANSTVCVRFNRHAVYLGRPGNRQRCPAVALGRTEAILVAPLSAPRNALPSGGSVAERTIRSRHLAVTATWNHDPAVVKRALGGRLPPPPPRPVVIRATRMPLARAASRAHATGTVYNGLGFDACSAPSTSAMTAWGASPYRALGVYIGGTNMACSQPNLTSTWVAQEWAAGWHLIPTYVGLQAPSNSCGCQAMSTSTATASSQGTAAAEDAVVHAQAIGIGAGNPIYDDMESYNRTSTNTSAVLAFLSGWTTQLHAEGYVSGRLQQRHRGDHRPLRSGRDDLCRARRHLDRGLERRRDDQRRVCAERRLGGQPAPAPVPGRPQRDLQRRHDQHRQQLSRRRDRVRRCRRRRGGAVAEGQPNQHRRRPRVGQLARGDRSEFVADPRRHASGVAWIREREQAEWRGDHGGRGQQLSVLPSRSARRHRPGARQLGGRRDHTARRALWTQRVRAVPGAGRRPVRVLHGHDLQGRTRHLRRREADRPQRPRVSG